MKRNSKLYTVGPKGGYVLAAEVDILHAAETVLLSSLHQRAVFSSPSVVKDYLRVRLGQLPYEVFAVLFLDSQNQLLEYKEMFRGSVTQTSVYPREVLREAMKLNASAIVLAHNHPSGTTTPSSADEALTSTLKTTMALVDVRVLDHIVVTATDTRSFAECGLL